MLNCERHTVTMERRVRSAARRAGIINTRNGSTWFEHGQWFVENVRSGAQWSVHDSEGAEGVHTFDGFCFEQVTRGEE